jgi:uncharacterized membrane protein HdeD (DUF308 family)
VAEVSKLSGAVTGIAIGVMLLVWPEKTLLVVAALIGVLLVLLGVSRLWQALAPRALPSAVRAPRLLAGVLLVVLGIAVLRRPADSLSLLTMLLGIAWIVGGLAELAFNYSADEPAAGVPAEESGGGKVLGALEVIAGLVLFLWPQTSLTVVVWVIGLWLIAIGLLQLFFAIWTRRPRPD